MFILHRCFHLLVLGFAAFSFRSRHFLLCGSPSFAVEHLHVFCDCSCTTDSCDCSRTTVSCVCRRMGTHFLFACLFPCACFRFRWSLSHAVVLLCRFILAHFDPLFSVACSASLPGCTACLNSTVCSACDVSSSYYLNSSQRCTQNCGFSFLGDSSSGQCVGECALCVLLVMAMMMMVMMIAVVVIIFSLLSVLHACICLFSAWSVALSGSWLWHSAFVSASFLLFALLFACLLLLFSLHGSLPQLLQFVVLFPMQRQLFFEWKCLRIHLSEWDLSLWIELHRFGSVAAALLPLSSLHFSSFLVLCFVAFSFRSRHSLLCGSASFAVEQLHVLCDCSCTAIVWVCRSMGTHFPLCLFACLRLIFAPADPFRLLSFLLILFRFHPCLSSSACSDSLPGCTACLNSTSCTACNVMRSYYLDTSLQQCTRNCGSSFFGDSSSGQCVGEFALDVCCDVDCCCVFIFPFRCLCGNLCFFCLFSLQGSLRELLQFLLLFTMWRQLSFESKRLRINVPEWV